ncbi:hypothetical protein P9210_08395 [Heyndrickxia coagulans]|nr:hypothetical protein [Heyndrickxia coagulans]
MSVLQPQKCRFSLLTALLAEKGEIHWKFLIICENTIMNNCCFAMMTHPD